MNRFAKIMLAVGALAAALWALAWAQGFTVDTETKGLAAHTGVALAAAACTLLSRCWALSYLFVPPRLPAPAVGADAAAHLRALRSRRVAGGVSALVLALLVVMFVLSGALLWREISALVHAILGSALVLLHVTALVFEARAISDDDAAARALRPA